MHFLKEFEDTYFVFEFTGGRVVDSFTFPESVSHFITYLFRGVNANYDNYCEKSHINPHGKPRCYVNADASGKCYMVLLAPDGMTRIVIVQDDSDRTLYKDVIGKKISETEFAQKLQHYQERRLQFSYLPKRFLSDAVNNGELPPINMIQELNIRELVQRMQLNYIQLASPTVIKGVFEEPDNDREISMATYGTTNQERVNEIIPYETRKNMFLRFKPRYVFEFTGQALGKKYEAYVYYVNGYTLCSVEPESGLGYQLFLNLGPDVKIEDGRYLYEIIKTVMEAPHDVIMADDAIIRKGHTTEEAFLEGLEVFLNGAKSIKPIKYATNRSYDVYQEKLIR